MNLSNQRVSFFERKAHIKRKYIIYATGLILLLGTSTGMMAHTQLEALSTFDVVLPTKGCESLEEQIRTMSTDEINRLLIVASERLTDNYEAAIRPDLEEEFNRSVRATAAYNAVEHMNEVNVVLGRSIQGMPTTTLAER